MHPPGDHSRQVAGPDNSFLQPKGNRGQGRWPASEAPEVGSRPKKSGTTERRPISEAPEVGYRSTNPRLTNDGSFPRHRKWVPVQAHVEPLDKDLFSGAPEMDSRPRYGKHEPSGYGSTLTSGHDTHHGLRSTDQHMDHSPDDRKWISGFCRTISGNFAGKPEVGLQPSTHV